jgi:DNA-binding GntR family transcriptional regulator
MTEVVHASDDTETPESLGYRPLQEIVRQKLREAILAGRQKPGDRLGISALSRRFGVSAIPVREALRGLEAEGMIEFSPNRGAIVKRLSPEELREIFLIRVDLESLSIRHAIPNLTNRDFRHLDNLIAQMDASSGNAIAWLNANQKFHLAISKAAHLPRLYLMLTALWGVSRPYLGVYMAQTTNPIKARAEHVALVEACRRQDAEAAVRILVEHVADTQNIVLSALDGVQPDSSCEQITR